MLKENINIAYFNLLKFIGAFAIAIFYHWNGHFLPSLGLENPYSELPVIGFLSQKGMIFVEMYFIISGYLFALVYRDKIEQKQITLKTFLINRIVRIYPMMTISTLFMYLSNHYLFAYNGSLWSYGHLDLLSLAECLLFGGSIVFDGQHRLNVPLWYISVLLVCYVIAYLITKTAKSINPRLFYLLMIIIGLVVRYGNLSYPFLSRFVSRGYIAFFVGILLFDIVRRISTLTGKPKIITLVLLSVELVVACILVAKNVIVRYTVFCSLFIFPVIIILLSNCKWINELCSKNFFKWLGEISFQIYIWNFPILITLHILIVRNVINIDVTAPYFFVLNVVIHLIVACLANLLNKKLVKTLKKNMLHKSGL